MKWSLFSLACAAVLANAGCCGHRNVCSPCAPAGYGYGATYAPSTCPNGNCGPSYFQSGAAYSNTQTAYASTPQAAFVPAPQTAYVQGMPTVAAPYTSTVSLDYLPAY